jgi:hypothetical protein
MAPTTKTGKATNNGEAGTPATKVTGTEMTSRDPVTLGVSA